MSSAPFPHSPSQAIDRPLSWAWATVGDFQPPTPSRPFPALPLFSPPHSFLLFFLPCLLLSLPPFFPPILLPFPSISPFFPSHLPLFQKYLLCTYCVLNTLIAIQWQQKQTLGLLFWCGRQPVISLLFLRYNLNSDSLDLLSPDLEAPGNKGLVYFHSHFLQLPPSSSQQASH